MSSTAVLGFIKDINNKNIKAVNDRLKKEKPDQRYSDPKAEGLVYTLLHAAAATGSQEITAALLKAGADDAAGFTALMRLLQRGMWSDARQLLAAGDCSLNAQAPTGETALLLACSCTAPDLQLVSDLLAAGASAAAQDSPARNTPLLLAVKAGGPAGKAAAPAAGAGKGAAAAAAAAAQSSVDAAQQLLAVVLAGRPAVPEQLGATLLEAGLSGKLPDAVTAQLVALLPAEAVARAAAAACLPQPLTFQGLLGLKLHRTAVAHLVKSSGKEPGAPQDAAGNTHLHNAVSGPEDLPDLVAALLAVGLPADAVNGDGDTALHVAARAGHVEACRALVAGGADVMRRNNKNRVPGNQLKAEEAWRLAKEQKNHQLWDAKMKAMQTASAFGIRVT
ncbi:hypothetical protein OEZ85_001748 [Tetradesmus obliquus]|uniref:Uncharacterized protein n=1 Tax=Tetradesmus obliquus TaxID=3088 RepID=A0ABY8U5V3_TETOB|nr:hypothetical protein OEZ85_001748 [Tetradesmus obliquus]